MIRDRAKYEVVVGGWFIVRNYSRVRNATDDSVVVNANLPLYACTIGKFQDWLLERTIALTPDH